MKLSNSLESESDSSVHHELDSLSKLDFSVLEDLDEHSLSD